MSRAMIIMAYYEAQQRFYRAVDETVDLMGMKLNEQKLDDIYAELKEAIRRMRP